MVVEQNELQNECRSRETCSFGTPDAVVCKAARSASAVLAAVGRSVGIGARAGAGFVYRAIDTHRAELARSMALIMTSTPVRYPTPNASTGSPQPTSVEVTDPLLCPPELELCVSRVSHPC